MDSKDPGGCIFRPPKGSRKCGRPIEARGLCSRHRGLYRRVIDRSADDPNPITWADLEAMGRALPAAKRGPKSDDLDALQTAVLADRE
jgi:hypothetical protein